ncbi:patatin-like phospholipase family protein [Chryseobacterium sp. JUb7]|uniref:patatin-like phospholipase family protein n=1 Tax=Chryseobacterium sp. JUb7 TaxID=2940599 RepID=UPI00216A3D86|nr:patatin-like phospholipase family protein [Chryseobacterium sp. JUb7]MCS3528681.1 NTE family protein [Chryseobacterium sp. JUb7]
MENYKKKEINKSFEKIIRKYGHLKASEKDKKTITDRLEYLKKNGKFSDVTSDDPNEAKTKLQWIDFVQQGGGTLGISLVGYTFVLEYVGIRFLRLAGTSAGAINTLFLAAIGEKDDPKTPELFDMMDDVSRFNMKSFIDTKNKLIRQMIFKGKGLIMNFLGISLVLLLLVLFPLPVIGYIGVEGKVVYVIFMIIFIVWIGYIYYLLTSFGKNNFGISPGNAFESFLEKELRDFGVENQKNLDDKAKLCFKFKVEGDHAIGIEIIDGQTKNNRSIILKLDLKNNKFDEAYQWLKVDYSFVTTDMYNECKIVLPREANLYFENSSTQNPAQYVRASMAIPFFFKPKIFKTYKEKVKDNYLWESWKGINIQRVKTYGVCIDGGSLSNFPINLFHNSKIEVPRVPIFGARIVDEKPINREERIMSFGSFLKKIINTLRSNEDNSFLAINPFYKKYCIAEIKTYDTQVSWLNFDLTQKQKDALFIEGVEEALCFLEKFDWENYKLERKKV